MLLLGVLSQASVANLDVAKLAFNDSEWMLDLCALLEHRVQSVPPNPYKAPPAASVQGIRVCKFSW